MEEIFVTKIKINEVLNIKDFDIFLSETEKKHLIITGKNGSGKTTVLRDIKKFIETFTLYDLENKSYIAAVGIELNVKQEHILPPDENELNALIKIDFFNSFLIPKKFLSGEFIFAFFGARRNIILNTPNSINKVDFKPYYEIEDNAGQDFIQYIVNLEVDKSFAKNDNKSDEVKRIDTWFEQFKERLFDLFEIEDAKLEFDRKSYNFNVIEHGKQPYNLNQLSDGYSAILNIVTELIMRMEEHKTKSYDVQGIVLIDEIETHLHIDLQKKVLPFLISFFPKIQFIVTTHSPFVITSIKNAVVCDLEKKIVIADDLSGYSYEAIVEGYFDSDKYSEQLKSEVTEYETLMSKDELTDAEDMRLKELGKYLDKIPKFLADELAVKLQQIKLKKLNKKVQK